VSRDEGHNGNLCKTSVVKLARSLPLHGLFANTGEVNGREDHGGERSTLSVVNFLGLGDQLSDEDGGEDLCLSSDRDSPHASGGLMVERDSKLMSLESMPGK